MRILKRRRLESKTDYRARLTLLKSGRPRLVVRKTNRYIIAQLISSDKAQDKIIVSVTSKDLLSKGVPSENAGSLKSRTAAYLTGFLLGKLAKGKVKEAILDLGMHRNIHKSRLYAVVGGALEAGIQIPHSKEAVPSYDEIKSQGKLAKVADKVKQSI